MREPEWERVGADEPADWPAGGHAQMITERLAVPGGWLYRLRVLGVPGQAGLAFVPNEPVSGSKPEFDTWDPQAATKQGATLQPGQGEPTDGAPGARLRAARQAKGMSMEELSAQLGLDVAVLADMERGLRPLSPEVRRWAERAR